MKLRLFIITGFIFLIAVDATAQCSMCRAVLESENSQSAAEGINDGILYLMAFPYILMAGVAYFIWRSRRKNRAQAQE